MKSRRQQNDPLGLYLPPLRGHNSPSSPISIPLAAATACPSPRGGGAGPLPPPPPNLPPLPTQFTYTDGLSKYNTDWYYLPRPSFSVALPVYILCMRIERNYFFPFSQTFAKLSRNSASASKRSFTPTLKNFSPDSLPYPFF